MYGERILRDFKKQLMGNQKLVQTINKILEEHPFMGNCSGASYLCVYIDHIELKDDDVVIYIRHGFKRGENLQPVEELLQELTKHYSPTRAREIFISLFKYKMQKLIKQAKEEV